MSLSYPRNAALRKPCQIIVPVAITKPGGSETGSAPRGTMPGQALSTRHSLRTQKLRRLQDDKAALTFLEPPASRWFSLTKKSTCVMFLASAFFFHPYFNP